MMFLIPSRLQALDGFLFVVNTEGRVEYVTENVKDYINFTKDEVLGKDIYNIIHIGDAGDFMPNVLPQSVGEFDRTHACFFFSLSLSISHSFSRVFLSVYSIRIVFGESSIRKPVLSR